MLPVGGKERSVPVHPPSAEQLCLEITLVCPDKARLYRLQNRLMPLLLIGIVGTGAAVVGILSLAPILASGQSAAARLRRARSLSIFQVSRRTSRAVFAIFHSD
jgi:hypothetical protein